jgi:hypothetical protein
MEKMKTSNKILTTFLSIIAIYFLVFALDLRLLGEHRSDRKGPEYEIHRIEMSDFEYLKLENVKNLTITPALNNTSYVEIRYLSDTSKREYLSQSMLDEFQPTFYGDTIVLSRQADSQPHFGKVIVFIPDSTSGIIATNSSFRLLTFHTGDLDLVLDNSQLNGSGISLIDRLNITASNNSNINAYDKYLVDTLNISLENSTANFNKPIKQLLARVDSKSNLHLMQVDDIQIKKEKGSKVYFR